ncbi:hypothetical protein [Ancylobacter amanitiformis]|uniref:Uncharacterized protein n=1 Tax=Ancylobacter amanitiformis TaxID=217069 RepID=A0ABU0LXX6_9HYPH|nr:hypothetical protein [Ancylobacter amanitiformis]MDQ0513535.1 hypothetical protein [Ancylobacter amanitiformis]
MELGPFGVLNNDYKRSLRGLHTPMPAWKTGDPAFRSLLDHWLNDVADNIWPAWQRGNWVGAAAATKEAAAKAELELAVRLYHGQGQSQDVLTETPDVPATADGRKPTHEWHYKIEDALVLDPIYLYVKPPVTSFDFRASRTIGSNYLVYDPTFETQRFERLFWGRMSDIQPSTWDIKLHFERPRPWTVATVLDVQNFRWVVAGGDFVTHTGVHPSLLSGHCIQGILGGCSVLDALLDDGGAIDPATFRAIQKYMVDWGDRRVFAGVHYMTDNIASWTLARRLIPHLFNNAAQVKTFAVQAITEHSRVFADIVEHFDSDNSARGMLIDEFGAPS